jgi:hypothetical protein
MTHTTVAIIAFIFGGSFLLLALISTFAKVTFIVLNPWLLRELRCRDQPMAFAVTVFLYWLLGAGGTAIGIVMLIAGIAL